MKRRVMQLLFAVGLVLTLAASTLWYRTLWVSDSLVAKRSWVAQDSWTAESFNLRITTSSIWVTWKQERIIGQRTLQPTTRDLQASIEHSEAIEVDDARASAPWQVSHATWPHNAHLWFRDPTSMPGGPPQWWERLGFVWWSIPRNQMKAVGVPMWLLVLIPAAFATVPFLLLYRDRRHQVRRARGLCPTCGYDLRGAAHERCPECGAEVEPSGRDARGLPPAAGSSRSGPGAGASS